MNLLSSPGNLPSSAPLFRNVETLNAGSVVVENQASTDEIVIHTVKWKLPTTGTPESKPFIARNINIGPFLNCSLVFSREAQGTNVSLTLGKVGDYAKKEEVLQVIVKTQPRLGTHQTYLMQKVSQENWTTKEKILLIGETLELDVYTKRLVSSMMAKKVILKNYTVAFDDQIATDVVFKVKEKKFGAHVFVVSAMSPVFRAMFQHEMKESTQREVAIEDIKPQTFHHMLRFMYTATIPNTLGYQDMEELFQAADMYGIDLLKEVCETFLCMNVSEQNVFSLLRLADQYSSKPIREVVFKYLIENAKAICFKDDWKQLMREQPSLAHEVMVVMVTGKIQDLTDNNSEDIKCKQQ